MGFYFWWWCFCVLFSIKKLSENLDLSVPGGFTPEAVIYMFWGVAQVWPRCGHIFELSIEWNRPRVEPLMTKSRLQATRKDSGPVSALIILSSNHFNQMGP